MKSSISTSTSDLVGILMQLLFPERSVFVLLKDEDPNLALISFVFSLMNEKSFDSEKFAIKKRNKIHGIEIIFNEVLNSD